MAEGHPIFRTHPPHLATGSDKQKCVSAAYTAASSTALDLGIGQAPEFVWLIASTDCHIAFGPTGMGAATANDLFLPAKTFVRFECRFEEGFVRAIRDAADGVLYAYTPA